MTIPPVALEAQLETVPTWWGASCRIRSIKRNGYRSDNLDINVNFNLLRTVDDVVCGVPGRISIFNRGDEDASFVSAQGWCRGLCMWVLLWMEYSVQNTPYQVG